MTGIEGRGGAGRRIAGIAAGPSLLSIGAFLLLWAGCAALLDDPALLPGPLAIARIIVAEAAKGDLFHHMAATAVRVLAAFFLAMSAGCAAGLILGRNARLNQWLDPWVIFFLNIPALIVIVLCYLWIGLTEVAIITAVVLAKLFPVIVTIREGARALDPRLDDMAYIFRFSFWRRLRHVLVPQLAPFIAASARNGLSIIWKIVLVAEFLGRGTGVGFQIHLYFQLFEISYVLAYSLSFVGVMLVIEYAIVQRIERAASRWRQA